MDQARRWPVRFVRAALCCSACASEGASALPFMGQPVFASAVGCALQDCALLEQPLSLNAVKQLFNNMQQVILS